MTTQQMKAFPTKVYRTAIDHPGTASAVALGTGVAAALLWLATRNGTFSALQKKIFHRGRSEPKRLSRKNGTRRTARV